MVQYLEQLLHRLACDTDPAFRAAHQEQDFGPPPPAVVEEF